MYPPYWLSSKEGTYQIEKLAFYSDIKGKEEIAVIDEKLLEYWK